MNTEMEITKGKKYILTDDLEYCSWKLDDIVTAKAGTIIEATGRFCSKCGYEFIINNEEIWLIEPEIITEEI